MSDSPQTLIEAVRYFSALEVCHTYMAKIRWADGKPVCPACEAKGDRIGQIATRHMLRCKDCRKQFSHKVGTIFEDSPLGLDKWFVAVWAIANCKNGISSHELARALGVTQKTAWFMLHRIRMAMKTRSFRKLAGEVETDETFIGGKSANMHKAKREKRIRGRGAIGKQIVQGLLERGGEVRTECVGSTDDVTLTTNVRRHVEFGSNVYSDAAPAYAGLSLNYFHKWVDHIREYAVGKVHTNGLENFWSLLKRSLKGTYVAVATFHMERYLDEQCFRYNQRKLDDAGRFKCVLDAVVGKRLTWRILTAQGDAGFMGIK